MKKHFGHSKKAVPDREEYNGYDESGYDWDGVSEGGETDQERAFYKIDEDGLEDTDYAVEQYSSEDIEQEADGAVYEAGSYAMNEEYEEDGYMEEAEETYYEVDGYVEEETEESYYEADGYAEEEAEESYYEAGGYAGEEAEESYYEADGYIEEEAEESYYEAGGYAEEEAEESYYEADGYIEGEMEESYYEVGGYAEEEMEEPYYEAEEAAQVNYETDEYSGEEDEALYEEYAEDGPDYGRRSNRAETRQYAGTYESGSMYRDSAGLLGKIGNAVRRMEVIDWVMLCAGAGVLILAIVAGSVFFGNRAVNKQMSEFRSVGKQIDGITVIGEHGLAAVANEEAAKLEAAMLEASATPEPTEEPRKEYDEKDYDKRVSVEPEFTSVQKDLKIKFINARTNKLVAHVPFSVTILDPDGQTLIWSDDDMDGIITKKDLKPGTYKVTLEALSDAQYANYSLSTVTRTVEVKKEITYAKVDVANEVKTEAEVDAAKEDTKKNETTVESSLQDTVAWVESQVIGATYSEVPKNTIPDPAAIAMGNTVLWGRGLIMVDEEEPDSTDAVPESSQDPSPSKTEPSAPEETMPSSEETPTPESTPEPSQEPTQEPTQEPVPTVTPTPVPVKGTISVDNASLTAVAGAQLTVKAAASGFAEGSIIVYSVVSSAPAVATAAVDAEGNISVTGVAAGTAVVTVTANYQDGGAETAASADITVVIGGNKTMSLDKTSLTVFVGTTAIVTGQIENALSREPIVTAESSDGNIASVTVDGRAVTVSGVTEGNAVITVRYTENNETVSAECAVTVKKHPSEDRENLLKDADGQQLYVMEDNTYREAVYADYYTAEKFFIKGAAKYTGWQTIEGKVYYYTGDGVAVTGEQVIQGATYHFASDGSMIVGDGVLGIDVSKWNGNINWNAVKNSGVSYVIIRCGYRGSAQGQLIADPKFEANIKGATSAGLKVGIYFFSQAIDEVEAVEEASMVLEQIKGYTISYPVFIDVEASGGRGDEIDRAERTAVCKAFCQTIQNGGYTAGVYSNKVWLESKIDAGSLNAYKIWLAQYAAAPTYTGKYDLWQYRSTGSVGGISGDVDMNISYLGY